MTDDICEPRSYATLQVMDIGSYPKSFRVEPLMVYLVHAWRAAGFFIIWSQTFCMGKGDVRGRMVISDTTDVICEQRSYATLQVMDKGSYPKSFRVEPFMVYRVHAWQAAGFFIIWSHTFYMGKGDVGGWVLISDMTDDICELR